MNSQNTLGVLLFPDFELLDVFGPLEMFGSLPNHFNIVLISEKKDLIKSAQGGITVQSNANFQTAPKLDILLIPGGLGTRREIHNTALLEWIKERAEQVTLLLSVCTGAALLAKSGVLDNRQATSNKVFLDWVKEQGPKVRWVDKARWVDNGNIITSSGVAAGIDMSLYVIAKLYGVETAKSVADRAEYMWNQDPAVDPFFVDKSN